MPTISERLSSVRSRIDAACRAAGRSPGEVRLLAVSKTQPVEAIAAAVDAGQACFGENYLQEALVKVAAYPEQEWHFIGPLQSNKTRAVAENFAWVHSVDRARIARRLSEQRPAHLAPLNICLQVNISDEASKSGVALGELGQLVGELCDLPGLRLRGLMAIPAPSSDVAEQRATFARLRQAQEALQADYPRLQLDTLSMGMSGDLEAAIAEGATLVRIGTAVFGPRATAAQSH